MAIRRNVVDSLRTSDGKIYPHTSSSTSHRVNSRPSAVRENEHDRTIDKYSTLFTPSTPRASPTLLPVALPTSSTFRSQVQKEHSHSTTCAYSSVSAHEDPLSLSIAPSNSSSHVPTTFERDNDDVKQSTTPSLMPIPSPLVVSSSSRPSYQPTRTDNASLTFFDNFAQDAKRNSEMRRKGLVDELVKCDNDPLYFLHSGHETVQKKYEEGREDQGEEFNNDKQPTSDSEQQTSPSSSPASIDTVLHDLDDEYFSAGRLVPDSHKTPSQRRSSMLSYNRSSMPSPPTLAPPIMDSNISSDLHSLSDTGSTKIDTSSSLPSSTFSARWMSNLLKTSSGSGHHQHGATQTLESIFNVDASSSPPSGTSPTAASTVSAIRRRTSSSPPISYHPIPQPHVPHTLPIRRESSSSSLDVVIKHMASPFGTHTYIPSSGAPGFRGESYDWDKGFSNELEREIARGAVHDQSSGVDELVETEMRANVRVGIGAFMEKKTGKLDLKGRRESTTSILSQNLAILLRPHFPALSRLPQSWTLIYSLDQHGISLNTLYTRCEETLSPSRALYPTRAGEVGLGTRGVLLIIKDAGAAGGDEGAFGAWIANGEGLSMGKKGGKGYFGGGESFLWKFTQGTLKVYQTTGINSYVALCEPDYISFGGGDGHYGLYLDDTLYDGSSAPCPTFNNEPLCSPGLKKAGSGTVGFECVGLEVWGMGP